MTSITTTHTVVGMTCGHCARSVHDELIKLDGVTDVAVDLACGEVTVESTVELDRDEIADAVAGAGYEVVP